MDILLYIVLIGLLAVLIVLPIFLFRNMAKVKQIKQKIDWLSTQEYTVLRIDVPKDNEKKPLSAEQMLSSIHGIYSENSIYQNHVSFEIVSKDKFIQFYIYLPKHLKDFIEGQIYAQYPTVEINEVEDYVSAIDPERANFSVLELGLTKPDVYPIKMFTDFEVDPLSAITSVMSKLNTNEEVWFQFVLRPVGDEWQEKGNGIISSVRSGKKAGSPALLGQIFSTLKKIIKMVVIQAINPGAEILEAEQKKAELPSTVEEALKGIEKKITKLGYETKIRILAIAPDPMSAKVKCQSVAATFKQFNTTNLNGFRMGESTINNLESWAEYAERVIEDNTNIFNVEEIASIYHLPHKNVETPNIVWSGAKKGEPPSNLPLEENTPPKELTIMGETNFRNTYKKFGIKLDDRKRHMYIIGKSGVGKSVFIENMAIDDVVEGRGIVIVDPHGELADKIMSCVPDERIDDVVVFDPSDRGYPVAFNLLEHVDDDFKGMVASGFVGIFKKIFGDSWGPRLEHILRNTILALLDYPDSTMLDIPKMLTDNRFRDKVVEKVKDPVIRDFWVNEFAQYDAKFRTEAVSPILNKVGQFLATSTIRNIVGQPRSKINIREIMDQEKILIINLSRGKIGEDNSALLGAMMITKIQLAAMSRADVTIDKRPDCFLYVDEFQNFATESFAVILAEARKYNLALTMANQYVDQLKEEVRSAVFGNAGTIVSFRVGGSDADFLVKEFEPVFSTNDLVNLNKWTIYIKLLIDGVSSPAFSARTLPPVQTLSGNYDKIMESSRQKYSALRADVEQMIANRSKEEENELFAEAETFRKGGLEALLVKRNGSNGESSYSKPSNQNFGAPRDIRPAMPEQVPTEKKSVEPIEVGPKTESSVNEEKKDKPRVFKYQNIVGDKLYKEQTARGGIKWYVGEEIDLEKLKEQGIVPDENGLKMIELAKKANGNRSEKKNDSNNDKPKNNQLHNEDKKKDENKPGGPSKQAEPMKQVEPPKKEEINSDNALRVEVSEQHIAPIAKAELKIDETKHDRPVSPVDHDLHEVIKVEDQTSTEIVGSLDEKEDKPVDVSKDHHFAMPADHELHEMAKIEEEADKKEADADKATEKVSESKVEDSESVEDNNDDKKELGNSGNSGQKDSNTVNSDALRPNNSSTGAQVLSEGEVVIID